VTPWHERDILELIDAMAARQGTTALLGDDAAVLEAPPRLAICADLVTEGIHFDSSFVSPEQVGAKAVAVNISDLAATGARPLWLLVTVAAPEDSPLPEVLVGIERASDRYGAVVVGGDTTRGASLTVSVTAVGALEHEPLRRSGARPGDWLLVTGPLGGSARGLRLLREGVRGDARCDAYLAPTARPAEGRLAARLGAHAAIDVSDGFALDLTRLADASGVGFALEQVPVAADATLEEALGGGEDFELILAAPDPDVLQRGFASEGLSPPIPVGRVLADPGRRELQGAPLAPSGWWHGAQG
jgi:thiamine-monophosphate kinase